jgi:hypothetical protein
LCPLNVYRDTVCSRTKNNILNMKMYLLCKIFYIQFYKIFKIQQLSLLKHCRMFIAIFGLKLYLTNHLYLLYNDLHFCIILKQIIDKFWYLTEYSYIDKAQILSNIKLVYLKYNNKYIENRCLLWTGEKYK